jgi:LysM repeat protein
VRLRPALVLLACVAALAAACGGDDSEPTGAAPDSSRIPTATMPAELPEVRILGEGIALAGGGATYTIQSGDTLAALAERFGFTVEDLLAANPGIEASALRPGQQINLPGDPGDVPPPPPPTPEPVEPEPTPEPPPPEEPTPEPQVTEPPAAGQIYVVQSGDLPVTIAEQFGISVEALLAANPDINPNALNIGDELVIPAPAE